MTRPDDQAVWQGGVGNVNVCVGAIQMGGTAVAPPPSKGRACPECGHLNWRHAHACGGCGLEFHPGRRIAWRLAIVLLLAANVGASTRFLL